MAGVFLNHFPPVLEIRSFTDLEPSDDCARLADQ